MKEASIGAIILAAGMSKRMGKAKLLLSLNGKSVIHHTIANITKHSFSSIILITGQSATDIHKLMYRFPEIETIFNPDYAHGMSTSLKCGIGHMDGEVDAVIIFLADQPLVSTIVVQTMIDTYLSENKNGIFIVRPKYQGVLGHPILIDKSIFHEFYTITGDIGGKHILKKYQDQVKTVHFENRYWGKDIDTPEDFAEIKRYLKDEKI